jgi:hypothetical protein
LSYELNAGLWIVNWIAKAVPAYRGRGQQAPGDARAQRQAGRPPISHPREIKAWIERSYVPISFPIEDRYVAGDDSS